MALQYATPFSAEIRSSATKQCEPSIFIISELEDRTALKGERGPRPAVFAPGQDEFGKVGVERLLGTGWTSWMLIPGRWMVVLRWVALWRVVLWWVTFGAGCQYITGGLASAVGRGHGAVGDLGVDSAPGTGRTML